LTAAKNTNDGDWASPVTCPEQRVEPAWIDYNGHLNMAFYHVLFDRALDHVYDLLGVGADYTRSGAGSCFTLEVHVNYLNELVQGDPVHITFQLLDHDSKRLHFYEEMFHGRTGELAATSEQLALHVDMGSRRSAPFPERIQNRIERLMRAHTQLPTPERVGQRMGIRRA
jgi:acyl-CoA thioester hydrolase